MKTKIKSGMLIIAMIMITSNLNAQSKKFENVKKISMNGVRTITDKNEVKGYYAFYFIEKQDKKNNTYLLEIMDANLKTTQTIQITKPKTIYLLEGQFNGKNFCFAFLDTKTKSLGNDIYDQNGKKSGTFNVLDLDNTSYMSLNGKITNEDGYYSGTISPVPQEGFLVNYVAKSKGAKYSLIMFDNKGTKKWTNNSGVEEKSYEAFNILNVNEKNIVGNFSYKKGLLSTETTQDIIILETKTGKKKSKFDIDEKTAFLVTHGVDYINEENEYVMFGEVFGLKNGKVDIKDKQGFFVRTYDETGKEKKGKICTWKGDISKKIDVNKKGKIGDGISVMIHNVIKTKDNRYFAIGEQFNKEISAGGAALKALGASTSAMKIALYNFMIFEFNDNLELENIEVIVLDKTNVLLPEGYGIVPEDGLGYLLKAYGWFNYNFSTINSDRSNFSAVYTVYNRGSENKGNRYTVGSITLDSDKKVVNSTLDLKSKPTAFVSLPTKPGYLAIFEYFKKEKSAEIRLEKLDL